MTKDEAIDYIIPAIKKYWNNKICNNIIKALKQESCTDYISRETIVNHICEGKDCYVKDCKGKLYKRCPDIKWVYECPSVTLQESEVKK